MSFQKNKQLMNEMLSLNRITEALKQVASGRMWAKKIQSINAFQIMEDLRAITGSRKFAAIGRELHIMISCDQRFCRGFLIPLNDYLTKIAEVLIFNKGEYELQSYSDNNIECGSLNQVLSSMDGAEPYKYVVQRHQETYVTNSNKIDVWIFGKQSHKISGLHKEYNNICFQNRPALKNFLEIEALFFDSLEVYDEVYIHGYGDLGGVKNNYVSYRSGFKRSLQPLLHLSQEVYLFMSLSNFRENTVRAQVMSEAADNTKKEAGRAKLAFNRGRQAAITTASMLLSSE